jgi:lipopolysaccharide export LptBFGC system permease protein LptF
MVLIAATFSVHGDTALIIAVGLGLYLLSNILFALGFASTNPVSLAAWTPAGVSWALGPLMFHLKDG